MGFMNRRSKIYSVGGVVLGLGAIIPNLMVFFGERDIAQTHTLINIGQFFLGLLFALLGTQTLFANRRKILGYIYFIVAAFNFAVLVTRFMS